MGQTLAWTKWQQSSVSFTNTSTGLFYVRGDTMAKLQFGVTHHDLVGQKSDEKIRYNMLVSQQETSQASHRVWQSWKNGSQLDKGFLHHLEKAQYLTHLFSKIFSCRIWLQIAAHTALHVKAGKDRFSITAWSQAPWIHGKALMNFSRPWRMLQDLFLARCRFLKCYMCWRRHSTLLDFSKRYLFPFATMPLWALDNPRLACFPKEHLKPIFTACFTAETHCIFVCGKHTYLRDVCAGSLTFLKKKLQ